MIRRTLGSWDFRPISSPGFTSKTLGKHETGASVSSPAFRDFMIAALKDKPGVPFRIPPGLRMVRINAKTGTLAQPGDKIVILEAYKPGTEPTDQPGEVVGGNGITLGTDDVAPGAGASNDEESDAPAQTQTQAAPRGGTGGLY